jgi:hypothetical protein
MIAAPRVLQFLSVFGAAPTLYLSAVDLPGFT